VRIDTVRTHILQEREARRHARGTGGGPPIPLPAQLDGDLVLPFAGMVPIRQGWATLTLKAFTLFSVYYTGNGILTVLGLLSIGRYRYCTVQHLSIL